MSRLPEPRRPRFALLAVALAAGWLTVWLSWPTLDYSHDAVAYAAIVHRAVYGGPLHILWHPYHMLYMPLGFVLAGGLLGLGLVVDVLGLLQVTNATLSALLVLAAAFAARRLGGGDLPALAAASLLGASLTVSYYATDPEVYPPSLLALAVAVLALLRLLEDGRTRHAAVGGGALGLACGFHAAAVLALPPVLVAVAWGAPAAPRRRAQLAGVLLAAFAVPAAGPYVALWQGRGLDPATGAVDLVREVAGARTFDSGPWLLGRGFRPGEEARAVLRGLAADPVEGGRPLGLAATGARALAMVLIALVALRLPALWRRSRWPTVVLGGWLLSFFLLFSAFNVGSLKFVGFQLLPLLLLVTAAAGTLPAPGRRAVAALLAAAAALTAWSNLAGTLLPKAQPGSNPELVRAEWVGSVTAPGDLVVALGQGPHVMQRVYLPYFAEREVLLLDLAFTRAGLSPAGVAARLAEAVDARLRHGARVVVLADVVEDPDLVRFFEQRFGLPPGTVADLLARYRLRPYAALEPGFALWEVFPAAPEALPPGAGVGSREPGVGYP